MYQIFINLKKNRSKGNVSLKYFFRKSVKSSRKKTRYPVNKLKLFNREFGKEAVT